ncbi:MAG: hypothetical protein HZA48_01170 [Planctomycetes bacterium]|nr:hypothetical protein [Planctomycetota bacterium]
METSNYILLVAGLLIVFFAVYMPRKKLSAQYRRQEEELFKPDAVRQNLDIIFVQLQEFSRDSLAKMDTKIRVMTQLLQEVDQKTHRLETLIKRAEELKAEGNPAFTSAPQTKTDIQTAPQSGTYPAHQKVYSLYDKGFPPVEIAKELGIDRGEVELIINLRNRTH